jgi:hypothetical protein
MIAVLWVTQMAPSRVLAATAGFLWLFDPFERIYILAQRKHSVVYSLCVLLPSRNHHLSIIFAAHTLIEPRSARGSFAARVGRQAGVRFAKRSNHEVLATEREPEGQAKRSKTFLTSFPFFPPFPSVPIHLITLSAIRVSSHCTQ